MARNLSEIALEIATNWQPPSPHAAPYLDAMADLLDLNSVYGADSASSVVAYFLANAGSWHGDTARRVKKELNAMLKAYYKAEGIER